MEVAIVTEIGILDDEDPDGRRVGRPKWVPTEDDIAMVKELGGRLTIPQLADYFGVSDWTLKQRIKEMPELDHAYRAGKALAISDVAQNLYTKAMKGNVTAMIFYLKARAGWREKDDERGSGAENSAEVAQTVEASRRNVLGRLAGIHDRIEKEASSS